ncbi:transcriptional regulator, HxlR family [Vibrio xiamenensis]|uniref:Transcriptional regulator, HxlR family n=1 Tax=Vibrio xiamenensis TaxID=861298 RepID=A0A1G8HJB8_9VIBR|nr:helix-turn-helix domain-containing protein [Vibrio xiamenensis]SDI06729.1 transcriptional regulator, HxlR family [Vibrio xiamenensis]
MENHDHLAQILHAGERKGDVFSDQCPSREVLNHVTSRWGVLVLMALLNGEKQRFSQLRKRILRISEKMLAQTLQALEKDGFVLRTVYPVVPPHVEYELTAAGFEVANRVQVLASWLEDNIGDIVASQQEYEKQRTSSH